MANETDKILVALLQKQGINQFLPLEKPNACKIDEPLYGFIKDNTFHICDASLKEYLRKDLLINQKGSLLVGIENGKYIITSSVSDDCFVLSEDNIIIIKSPEGYAYINQNSFLPAEKTVLNSDSKGIVFNVLEFQRSISEKKDRFSHYEIFHIPEYLPQQVRDDLPKIELGIHPYIGGELKCNLNYLFTIEDTFIFYNSDNGDIYLVTSDKDQQRGYNQSRKVQYIWYSTTGSNTLNFEEIFSNDNETDTKEVNVIVNGRNFRTEVIDDYGNRSSFYNGYKRTLYPSAEFLVLQCGYRDNFIIVVDAKGNVTHSKLYERSEIDFKNNLIKLRKEDSNDFSFLDGNGNEIISGRNKYVSSFQKAEIGISNHIVFDTIDKKEFEDNREKYRFDGIVEKCQDQSSFQGVIEISSGKTTVPINFSGVVTSMEREPFSEKNYPPSKQITIAWIDHYFNGKKSYYGLFVNENLVVPICYDEISFVQYDYYEEGEKHSFKKDNTQFIKIRKDKLYGVMDSWGREILPIEAHEIRSLSENSESEYVLAFDEEGYVKVIYRDKVISDYYYTKAELIVPNNALISGIQNGALVKLYSEDGITFICEGKIIAEFDFADITVYGSHIDLGRETDYNFLFLVEMDDIKGVFDSNGKEVFPLDEHDKITIRKSIIEIDGKIYGDKLSLLIDTNKADLINSVRNSNGSVSAYQTHEEYIFLVCDDWGNAETYNVTNDEAHDMSDQMIDWKYDFDNDEFVFDPEDDEIDQSNYPDDTDYERDTYYALGGDDYDAFREHGGSIDDMMNGMGL